MDRSIAPSDHEDQTAAQIQPVEKPQDADMPHIHPDLDDPAKDAAMETMEPQVQPDLYERPQDGKVTPLVRPDHTGQPQGNTPTNWFGQMWNKITGKS